MFYTTSLETNNPNWLNQADHCYWTGVSCTNNRVTSLALNDVLISGPYPSDLRDLVEMTSLSLSGNNLIGTVPNNLCSSSLTLTGDETNCPNDIGVTGCCDNVRLTYPESGYLSGVVSARFGTSDCVALGASSEEGEVCTFMKDRGNHDVFLTYPEGFPYANWLKVRNCYVREGEITLKNIMLHCIILKSFVTWLSP